MHAWELGPTNDLHLRPACHFFKINTFRDNAARTLLNLVTFDFFTKNVAKSGCEEKKYTAPSYLENFDPERMNNFDV